MKDVLAPELRDIEFRAKIVMVEYKARAEHHFMDECHEEHQIRRVARLNGINRLAPPNAEGKIDLMKQCKAILPQVSGRARGLAECMPVYVDPLEDLIAFLVPFSLRAYHGHFVSGLMQRFGFLPYPTIERDRQILDQDQNMMIARNCSLPRVEKHIKAR
ncbi:hypothetical protein QO004_001723 [Rhizobium mesoamericanum]|nr:hypothetical protein [Rhizobium mesoamericanum]